MNNNIRFSPFQNALFGSGADETFWGSARGAGKTFILIFLFLKRAQILDGYQAVIFRKRFRDFDTTIFPVIEKCLKILNDPNFVFVKSQSPKVTHKKTGATIIISAAETEDDTEKIQGANIHDLFPDEAQRILPRVLERIPAIVRAVVGDHPTHIYWAANPNGVGQSWLKRRFIEPARVLHPTGNIIHPDWTHPITGKTFKVEGHWQFETEEEIVEGEVATPQTMEVFLSKTWMNPVLNYVDYIANKIRKPLKDNETLRRQWEDNDWDAIAGEFYPRLSDACVDRVDVTEYDRILCGIDHGQRKTAVVWDAVDKDGVYRTFDCAMYHHMSVSDNKITGELGKASLIKARHPETELYIIDPAARQKLEGEGVRTIRKIYQEAGLTNLVYCKSNDRKAGWEALRTGFASGAILILKGVCKELIDSLAGLVTKETESEDCDKDDGTDLQPDGDHFADAKRYLYVNGFYTGSPELSEEQRIIEKMRIEDPLFFDAIYPKKQGVR